ncbi:FmdB family zinc ribbon protein [Candidatus Palauibacter irciniicola]|uniref:FmdB family zinc ribbon protein n=1 Tax=Candidatus Palauibacter irciniicola TaxID=3056733 RepID=UPI003B0178C4
MDPGARVPTYEYRCRGCRHDFERFQRMSDAAIRVCPSCGEEQVERLISTGGGIVFKGAGFYATDYRQPADDGGKSTAAKVPDGDSSASRDGASSGSEPAPSGSSEGGSGS